MKKGSIILVLVYVDDILITGPNSAALERVIAELHTAFVLKEIGLLSYFLGIEVSHTTDGMHL